jgi:hypothetical protein
VVGQTDTKEQHRKNTDTPNNFEDSFHYFPVLED